jgi:AMIN domain
MNKPFKNRHFLPLGKQLFPIILLSLSGIFTLQTITRAVPLNAQLQDWRFSPENASLEFSLSNATQPKYFYLSQPPRLVVDLPSTKLGYVPTQQNYSGAIQRIRLSQLTADVTRIVMDLAPGTAFNANQIQLQPASPNNPTRWVLRPFLTSYDNNLTPPYGQNAGLPPITYPPQQPIYSPQQPIYPPQQPIYSPQQPIYPPQQPIYSPQQPAYPSQQPIYSPQPTVAPQGNNNSQTLPNVSVPPLTPNNSSQMDGSILPPASFSTPFGAGNNNAAPLISPNFPVPGNNSIDNPNPGSGVVPWGQNLPVLP